MDVPVEPIAPGYDANLSITYPNAFVDAELMDSGELVAQFRKNINDDTAIFTARTDDLTIARTRGAEETEVVVKLPASATSQMEPDTSVVFDFIRIDGAEKTVIPGRWRWPVRKAVTRDVS
ncbi:MULTISPECIES: hypothetical protein [Hyphomonas]|uniref:Uncharacterized protein n=1 Tax=Hyphomonas adhaerens TaxID=81029 RepID=A0A3B9GYF0_9PROT|nr:MULTISPECIES: hypothetical protein [Hyphomonas]MBB40950.1 hypothetical protein [Hyphomonas sp.]HAE27014.1 hypothetical protein [Hyphomonas adhaerens]|tara:strand:+ start:5589 stop:5951 length:363 start_codon:yes stop_codon:yes gene_type:complete